MKILRLNRENSKEITEIAVKLIKQGKVIICPTDTVYGLIADATNKKAVEKIFKIKKRPKSKPLPVFIKDVKMAKELALIDKKQEKFLKKYWPGKTTTVLKSKIPTFVKAMAGRQKSKIKIYGVDKKTIALRVPKYEFLNNLMEEFGGPIIQTSANISGKSASTKIEYIIRQFGGQKNKPDLILDAGSLLKNKPSKVIDLTGEKLKVLRK